MEIKIVNPVEFPYWNESISEMDGVSIFHTSNWAKVLSETYNYKPMFFIAMESRQIIGFLPLMDVNSFITGHRAVSLPFSDECNPICSDGETFDLLWDFAKEYGKKKGWNNIQVRGAMPKKGPRTFNKEFFKHELILEEQENAQMKKFRGSTKRNIKKALKYEVKTNDSDSISYVKAFYRLNCFTRKRHGLPPQPLKLFRMIQKNILSKGYGYVTLSSLNNKIIAGSIFFKFNDTITYKYGASILEYQKYRANNLIMWNAIKNAILNGKKMFDFGRTDIDHYGLLQFKRGWTPIEKKIR
ncbi:MAG: peptidoglycan bridge formation glycyltransferase FemA/FemB family protein, partial [Desulfobacteraceae bacterium]